MWPGRRLKGEVNSHKPKWPRNKHKRSPVAAITAFINAYIKEQRTDREQQAGQDRSRKWREIFTLGFVILTTIGVWKQYEEMRKVYGPVEKQAKAAQDQIILTHPPRLSLNNIAIWPEDAAKKSAIPRLIPGNKISGEAFVVSNGSEGTTTYRIKCALFWREGPLPMYIDFDEFPPCGNLTPSPHNRVVNIQSENVVTTSPGDVFFWTLNFTVPDDYRPELQLYFVGFMEYRDSLGSRRATLFGRKYDIRTSRFEPVKNSPPWESYE
ncbi:MAG: hypothetical protein QOH65_701 [Methylobacteriaceae bacterium]|jgi:hypothetical protein|nr:hypothetical protein [Methylobacteriaceae bacterium]